MNPNSGKSSVTKNFNTLDFTDDYALTVANFPALKHFWKVGEALGATVLVDAIGGVNLTVGGLVAGAVTNTKKLGGTTLVPLSGTLPDPSLAGTTTVLMGIGYFGSSLSLAMGASATSGARMAVSASALGAVVHDGTNSTTAAVLAINSAAGGMAISYTPGGVVTGLGVKNASLLETKVGATATPGALIGARYNGTNQLVVSSAGIASFAAIAIWQFATTSLTASDIMSALAWMSASAVNEGLKRPYPGWKGKS